MPYIKPRRREELITAITELASEIKTEGELNYAVTKLLLSVELPEYDSPSYKLLNALIGVLESCKMEFYRRAVAPYEDEKIAQNGDVY